MKRVNDFLDNSLKGMKGKIVGDLIILDIIGNEVHYWTPQLNFRVEENEEDSTKSVVSGLIGPRPAVWTMFMFVYFSVAAIGFFIAAFGLSRWILGEYSNLILALPIAILFMLTAYRVGKYGEKIAEAQVEVLKQFVRDVCLL